MMIATRIEPDADVVIDEGERYEMHGWAVDDPPTFEAADGRTFVRCVRWDVTLGRVRRVAFERKRVTLARRRAEAP